jgi:HEPN domain-containing protein
MYLVSKGDEPVITHNISILVASCALYEPAFKELEKYDFLTGYAVSLRYPDDFYMPEVDEAREALAAAQEARAFVTGLLT